MQRKNLQTNATPNLQDTATAIASADTITVPVTITGPTIACDSLKAHTVMIQLQQFQCQSNAMYNSSFE